MSVDPPSPTLGTELDPSQRQGGLPLLRSLPGDTLHFPDRTRVHVRSFGATAEIVVEQEFRVPEDAEGLVVMRQAPDRALHFRDLVIERGGHTIENAWHRDDEPRQQSELVRETEAARGRGEIPGLTLWGLAELPPGERVTLRLRYQQDLEVHDEHHRIVVPRQLGPADDSGPLLEGGASVPVDLVFELDAAAPVAAYRVSDFGARVQVDGSRLTARAMTTGVGGPAVVEYWIAADQPYATVAVDPSDGSFALVVTGPRDIAPRPPEDIVVILGYHRGPAHQELASEIDDEIRARARVGDRADSFYIQLAHRAGLSGFTAPRRAAPWARSDFLEELQILGDGAALRWIDPLDRSLRPFRVVIITERGELVRPRDVARRRAALRERGVDLRVDVVTAGSEPISPRLERLAAAGGGKAVRARDFLGSRGVVDAITPDAGGLQQVRAQWDAPVRMATPDEPLRVDAGQQVVVFGRLDGPPPDRVALVGRWGEADVRIVAPVRTWPDTPMVRELHARAQIDATRLAQLEGLDSRSTRLRAELAEAHRLPGPGTRLSFVGAKTAELIEPRVDDPNAIEYSYYGSDHGCCFVRKVRYVEWPGHSLFDPIYDTPRPLKVRVEVAAVRASRSPEAIERVVWSGAPDLGACVMQTLGIGEDPTFDMGVRLAVSDDGTVRWMDRISGQRPLLSTEDCMAEVMEGWTFPASGKPSTVEIDLRLTLEPTEIDFSAPALR